MRGQIIGKADEEQAKQEAIARSMAIPQPRRLALARTLLARATELRNDVRQDLANETFGADDIQMETYNDIARDAAFLFPADPVLGTPVEMPDGSLRTYGTPWARGRVMANDLTAKRLDARLTRLVNGLEGVFGEVPHDDEPARTASEVLAETGAPDAVRVRDELEELRSGSPTAIEDRKFEFVSDDALRAVLVADYREAQLAFQAGAFKASAILSGGILEGLLTNFLRSDSATKLDQFEDATAEFPRKDGEISWDWIGLTKLIEATNALPVLGEGVRSLIQGARDFRDTVHPAAEARKGTRAGLEEAELLLSLVRLLYRDLSNL